MCSGPAAGGWDAGDPIRCAPLAAPRGKGAPSGSVVPSVVGQAFVGKLLGRHLPFLLPDESHAAGPPCPEASVLPLSSVQGLDQPLPCPWLLTPVLGPLRLCTCSRPRSFRPGCFVRVLCPPRPWRMRFPYFPPATPTVQQTGHGFHSWRDQDVVSVSPNPTPPPCSPAMRWGRGPGGGGDGMRKGTGSGLPGGARSSHMLTGH